MLETVLCGERTASAAANWSGRCSSAKTVHLYEGAKHELLNEINKEEVLADLHSWIDGTLISSSEVPQ